MDRDYPFAESSNCPRSFVRVFEASDSAEFVWHRDREDRIVFSDSDWTLQLDDRLPVTMRRPVAIPMGMYHRIIPGKDPVAAIRVIKI